MSRRSRFGLNRTVAAGDGVATMVSCGPALATARRPHIAGDYPAAASGRRGAITEAEGGESPAARVGWSAREKTVEP
jgi:hypothetical protein